MWSPGPPGGGGGPDGACRFKEIAMLHVSVVKNSPCPLSNLRKSYVPCHYLFGPQFAVSKVHVALSNLRNRHVDLRGQGPSV